MQDKASRSVASEDAMAEQAVMRLLLEDRGLFALSEIATKLGEKLAAEDAVARLERAGQIHRCQGFVFASRAAVVGADLWSDGS